MRSLRRYDVALVGLAMLAGAIVFTWPLAADPDRLLPGLGDPAYNAWILGWVADRARHLLLGLWDSPVFYPYESTLAFAEPLLAIGVPLAPLYWATGNAVLLHNVATILSYVVAGTGGYLLGRDLSGRRAAGLVAGTVAAFLPYRLAHLVHVQVLMAGWLWWAAWAAHRYLERPSLRRALALAAAFVMLGLSSLYWAYIGLLPLAAILAVGAWMRRPRPGPTALHAVAAALVCAAVFLPVAIPISRIATADDSPITNTVDPKSYDADVLSYVSGRPTLHVWGSTLRHGSGEDDLFPGLTAMALVMLALVLPRSRRDPWGRVYGGLAVVAVALSLGPAPAFDGDVLWRNPLFPLLSAHVPGFAQLRVPARFGIVAQLALTVFVARGVAAWLERRRAGTRESAATALLLAGLVFVEGVGAPIAVASFPPIHEPGAADAYEWLARQEEGAVLELPLDGWGVTHYTMLYQHRTLVHGHPIVNGVGRFEPALPRLVADRELPVNDPARSAEAAELLRALGVRYVVLHPRWFTDAALGEGLRAGFGASAASPPRTWGDVTIVDLGAPPPLPREGDVSEVPTALMAVSATRGTVSRLVDGDPASRWLSERPQSGGETIEVSLAAVEQIAGVRLAMMNRSLQDHPRRLEVAVSLDGEHERLVFSGSVLAALGFGLRRDPVVPTIEIRWPAGPARFVRLRQTGTSRWYWSVHELRLLEPAPAR